MGGNVRGKGVAVCEANAQWYVCESNGFAGCCSVDPCDLKGCPDKKRSSSSSSSSRNRNRSSSSSSSSSMIDMDTMTASPTMLAPDSTTPDATTPDATTPDATTTDSGITHTIPNDSTVTVTRHTTITRGAPRTTTIATSLTETPQNPTETETQTSSSTTTQTTPPSAGKQPTTTTTRPGGRSGSSIDTGTITGIAVGGVVFAVVSLVLLLYLWRWRRHRCRRHHHDHDHDDHDGKNAAGNTGAAALTAFADKNELHERLFGRRPRSDALPGHPTPHEAFPVGGGYGYDPFAPFGGRVDQPRRTSPPPANTFEMDGHGIQVSELPDTAIITNAIRPEARSVGWVEQRPSSDPQATLNHLPRENGRPTYINQWNQYKTLA